MIRIWILLGIVALLLGYWKLSSLPERAQSRAVKIVLGLVGVTAVLLLARAGQPWVAAAAVGLLAVLPVLVRLLGKRGAREPRADPEGAPRAASRMSRVEALEILGLTEGASENEVRAAHAELILRVHPDRGGSTYLAARVNLARDRLLHRDS